jgi:hypothetical protein
MRPTQIQYFEVERGRRFVAGLFWLPLGGTVANQRKHAVSVAKEQNFDLVVWRNGSTPAVGMASTKEGAQPGAYSAAAVISKTLELEGDFRSFLCAVQLADDRFLYVAQNGSILVDGDFIGTEDEVKRQFISHKSTVRDWQIIIAPEHWGVADSEERSFHSFLPTNKEKVQYKKWWALQPIQRNIFKLVLKFGVIAAIAMGSYYGWVEWKEHNNRLRAQEESEMFSKLNKVQTLQAPHPWAAMSVPAVFADSCVEAMQRIPNLSPGKWKAQLMHCDQSGQMTASWSTQEGTIESMLEANPGAVFSADYSAATLAERFDAMAGASDEPVHGAEVASRAFVMALQKVGIRVALAEAPTPTFPVENTSEGKRQMIADWKSYSWDISSSISPQTLMPLLAAPGVRLTSVSLKPAEGGGLLWILKGVLYVQP